MFGFLYFGVELWGFLVVFVIFFSDCIFWEVESVGLSF